MVPESLHQSREGILSCCQSLWTVLRVCFVHWWKKRRLLSWKQSIANKVGFFVCVYVQSQVLHPAGPPPPQFLAWELPAQRAFVANKRTCNMSQTIRPIA